jgi:hypothetical protein
LTFPAWKAYTLSEMAAQKPKIDLLIRKDLTQKYSGQLLLWALTVGRYIAIFTELVVIAGIIARFTLDYQRNNITENILEQQIILASYKTTENQVRRLSKQLETITSINSNRLFAASLLDRLVKNIPVDMRLDTLTIKTDLMEMSGVSLSPQGFAVFLSGLYTYQDFSDIVLDSIQSGGPQDPSLHFTLIVIYDKTTLLQNLSAE